MIQNCLFLIYGKIYTGRTYLWGALISKFRSEGEIVLAFASSATTSLLLLDERTTLPKFKIPLKLNSFKVYSISQQHDIAMLFQQCKLKIKDEVPILHQNAF